MQVKIDEVDADLEEEVKDECRKYGNVTKVSFRFLWIPSSLNCRH
jgi:hypothetical protein